VSTFPHVALLPLADDSVSGSSLLACGHPVGYRTLMRSPVFGLCYVCTFCGELESTEHDNPDTFTDRFGYRACRHTLGDTDCDECYDDGYDGPEPDDSGRGSVHLVRRRPGRRGAAAVGACRRGATALIDSALSSVGIWRW